MNSMTLAEFMAHIEPLSDKEYAHERAWSILRRQFLVEEVDPEGTCRSLVDDMRREDRKARSAKEMRSLLMGADLSGQALTDDELRRIFLDMYHLEYYLEYMDVEKRAWKAFLGRLFRLVDPKGLTWRGKTANGDVEARLGSIWTEEAAHVVLRLNQIMDLDPPARGPGTLLSDSLELVKADAMAPVVVAYTDQELTELEPHCALCHVKLLSALEPTRRQRIIQALIQ